MNYRAEAELYHRLHRGPKETGSYRLQAVQNGGRCHSFCDRATTRLPFPVPIWKSTTSVTTSRKFASSTTARHTL